MEQIQQTNIYNKKEHYYNCAVEILTNTITGEQSIGWVKMDSEIAQIWQNEDEEE